MPSFKTPLSVCRFGLATRDITPPVGIYHRMWGAASHDRSEGVHRPLTATALVFRPLEDDAQQQVIVELDHCLLLAADMNRLLDRVSDETGVAHDQLLVTFSHTHAAGLMDSKRGDLPGGDMIPPYLEKLAEAVVEAVREALDALQPVTISYGWGSCSLAANRDFWDAENELFVCGFNPDEPADGTVLVARVTDAAGKTTATLINYACHPTTLAWDNRLISPDFPGAMREIVEQATGAPCVFLQGASGDLGPREGFVGDVAVADRNGRQLGYAALSAIESLPPPRTKMQYDGPVISGATIGAWHHESLSEGELAAGETWEVRRSTVDLPYREGMPDIAETRKQLKHWQSEEESARRVGKMDAAADARAMVERMNRWLARLASLPAGDEFPLPVTLLRMGDAIWLAVEGEPYNLLQRSLRERFAGTPIVVMVLANGSRSWYLPPHATYGKGIYQESMANLAPGCLERLIEQLEARIETLLGS